MGAGKYPMDKPNPPRGRRCSAASQGVLPSPGQVFFSCSAPTSTLKGKQPEPCVVSHILCIPSPLKHVLLWFCPRGGHGFWGCSAPSNQAAEPRLQPRGSLEGSYSWLNYRALHQLMFRVPPLLQLPCFSFFPALLEAQLPA